MASQIQFDKFYNIINGEKRDSSKHTCGIDPATGKNLWDVPIGTQADVDEAVVAAEKAFQSWKKTTMPERKAALLKFKEAYSAHLPQMQELLSKENGKVGQLARRETYSVMSWLDWHANLTIPEDRREDDDKSIRTWYKPIGVCAGIAPWNFPLTLSTGKLAPALMAGCPIILKPSPFTPYTMLKLVEIAQQVFPPGLVQIVGGDEAIGPMLTAHPGIKKVSFTGSTATGKKIMEACAKTLKRVTLELGGNDAAIIMPDVDIKKVAPEVMNGGWLNSGQTCIATKRIYIHESIYKEFLAESVKVTESMKVGAWNEEGSALGPVQNKMQYDKVKEYFADSKAKGYTFATGSGDVKDGPGYFLTPAIIDNPPENSRIMAEEPFGPILPVAPFKTYEEVLEKVNASNNGLGGSVFGKDVAKATELAQQMETGTVWINSLPAVTPEADFGGVKESGIGSEWGLNGIKAYCQLQTIQTYKKKLL